MDRPPSIWTVIFAALAAADGLFLFWKPGLIAIGLFLVLGAIAAFFHWRDLPKVPVPKTPRGGHMTKPAAWASVAVGIGMVVVGGIQFAYRTGSLPSGAFLAVGVIYLICSAINLKRAYN